jgi:hypothetical protein
MRYMRTTTKKIMTSTEQSNLKEGDIIYGTIEGEKFWGRIIRIIPDKGSIKYLIKCPRKIRTLIKRIPPDSGCTLMNSS